MNVEFRDFFYRLGQLSIYILALLMGVMVTYFTISVMVLGAVQPNSQEEVIFMVDRGANLKTIAHKLEKEELVKHWWAFYYPGMARKGNNKTIQAGEYKLSRGLNATETLDSILKGDIVYYNYTIPEGFTLKQVRQRITETGLVSDAELDNALNDLSFQTTLNISGNSFEGYLYPETYQFARPIDARSVIVRMVNEGRKNITEDMMARAIDIGLSSYQVLILASIIEKESGKVEERATIASVYHNRLRIGMPLQSDPTVIYGIKDFDGSLTRKHLKKETLYNTYLNTGLPPTPICNPGLDSIAAALYPSDTDYLYFVSKDDGTHQFSATLGKHNKAVSKFVRKN